MCRLSDALYFANLRHKAILFWNANNTFSFHRINWGRLNYATTITTISRYMKHIMERMGLNPLVIPNGIPKSSLRRVNDKLADGLRSALGADVLLCKVARWDPDKRWMEAVEATARLKELGLKTTLLARGGREPYGQEVINKALSLGLILKEASTISDNQDGYLSALAAAMPADMIDIRFQLPLDFLSVMYRAANAVLANSGHEPFGIVGLEAMAAGGIVFTGSTGEDYSIPFVNSLMIETPDPMEIVSYVMYLKSNPQQMERMRNSARFTAGYYTWEAAVRNLIGKLENQGRIQGALSSVLTSPTANLPPVELIADEPVRQPIRKPSELPL
jgi:glycosyltransferase involved in cell wall biosynthesis